MRAAAYCGTRGIYSYMVPSIKSLMIHSNVERIYLIIEDDEFTEYLPPQCEVINISGQRWFPTTGHNYTQWWTYMAMVKTALSKILPRLDRVLYLDFDTIVEKDISDIWDVDIDGYYVAAVKEPDKSKNGALYFNAGVCMFNLAEIRRDRVDDECIYRLNKRHYEFPDQDVMNEVFEGRVKEIPVEFNVSELVTPALDPKVLHFAAIRKEAWIQCAEVQKYATIPWEVITE